jgi:hypothetical protein
MEDKLLTHIRELEAHISQCRFPDCYMCVNAILGHPVLMGVITSLKRLGPVIRASIYKEFREMPNPIK